MTKIRLDGGRDAPLEATGCASSHRRILATGTVLLSDPHGVEEMEKDDLDMGDALNVLRVGIVRDPEWENGEWRYHVETPRMTFVIAFESETTLMIVTAWRKKP